jgi:hypothetical protein
MLCAGLGLLVLSAHAGQDPTLNMQYALPVSEETTISASTLPIVSFFDLQSKRVSVRFTNAKAKDVIGWLQKNNVNFVIDDSDLPKDKTVSLNLENQPLEDVLEALGTAFGGSFQKRKEIYVYKPGYHWNEAMAPMIRALPGTSRFEIRTQPGQPPRVLPRFEMVPHSDGAKVEHFEFTPEQRKKFDADMEKIGKEMKAFSFKLGEEFKGFDKEFADTFLKNFKFDEEKMKSIELSVEKMAKEMELKAKSLEGKGKALGSAERTVTINAKKMEDFIASLTADQKKLMKDRGYLKLNDLTAAQKELIGNPKGEFEIKLKREDATVVIKND